ncbi:MAG: hypothetical protein E4G74_01445 [Erysipelotrichales bacterium]|nr:MAG: hypothetical protein E4G74_01445 [Erysipelotrichales bacterium]
MIEKVLIMFGSIASIGFGVWHLFVPTFWHWYSYIDSRATELIVAIRAINVFFSLSLILFGVMNLLFIHADRANRYALSVLLGATSFLWLVRVIFQLVYPQGTINPILQFGMLGAFCAVFLCYFVAFWRMMAK